MKIKLCTIALFLCVAATVDAKLRKSKATSRMSTIKTIPKRHVSITKQKQQESPGIIYHSEVENLTAYAPVEFSPTGIRTFLQQAYNRSEYSQVVLPNNFSHFIQFLEHGKKNNQKGAYTRSVFKLFGNKLKASPYVNSFAFSQMMNELPNLLVDHFVIQKAGLLKNCSNMMYDMLYDTFRWKYEKFKESPDDFLQTLSQELTSAIHTDSDLLDQEISSEQLRQSIVRFLEIALNKLIWSPKEQRGIWESVKTVANQIETLKQQQIITEDLSDDLYWTLIHRFCFFLDITGSELSIKFYDNIKNELESNQLAFLEIEEQEALLETKKDRIKRALSKGAAQSMAFNNIIVS